jgi:hypothetical protein
VRAARARILIGSYLFEKELERVAKTLVGRKCRFEDMICNEPRNVKFEDIRKDIQRGKHIIFGYAVVDNPEFWASPWWTVNFIVRYEGRYVVFRILYGDAVFTYALLRIL